MPLVHIVYGFTEGNWHGKKFRRALRDRGYSMTHDITRADYVIAHSGGCYDVPPLADNQRLMLINPTYWPGRSLAERAKNMSQQIVKSIRPGNKPFYHLYKTLRNIGYLFYHHRTNQFMIRRSKTFNLEQEIKHGKTLLVRNDHDPWITPDLDRLQSLNKQLHIARLPGEHDDCWLHPEPYIDYLEKYL
jgi:hypothetical protein